MAIRLGNCNRGCYLLGDTSLGMAGPFITISGPPGCGATTVSAELAAALDCEWISGGDIFRELAEDRDMTLTQFTAEAEADDRIDRSLDRRLRDIAAEHAGEAFVLESRLAGWLAGEYADLRIWLDAPTEVRVERLEDRDDEFESELRVREVSEWGRYEDYYDIDIHDTSFYDLSLNTARWSEAAIADVVLTAVESYDPEVDEGAFQINLDV
jgi:cytidylate kinase